MKFRLIRNWLKRKIKHFGILKTILFEKNFLYKFIVKIKELI